MKKAIKEVLKNGSKTNSKGATTDYVGSYKGKNIVVRVYNNKSVSTAWVK